MAEKNITIGDLFKQALEFRKRSRITKIELKSPKEVFGNKAMRTDRQVVVVYTEDGREAHVLPKGITYEDGEWKIVNELDAVRSVRNQNSWFRKFYKKYNCFPKEGMEVDLTMNARGFVVIDV